MPSGQPDQLVLQFAWAPDPELDDLTMMGRVVDSRLVSEILSRPQWRRHGRYLALWDGRAKRQRVRVPLQVALEEARGWPRPHMACEVGILGLPAYAPGPFGCLVSAEPHLSDVVLDLSTMEMTAAEVDEWFALFAEALAEFASMGAPIVGSVRWANSNNLHVLKWLHSGVSGPLQLSYWPAIWIPNSTASSLDLESGRAAGWLQPAGEGGVVVRFADSLTSVTDDDRQRWREWLSPVLELNFAGSWRPDDRSARPSDVLPQDWRSVPWVPPFDPTPTVTNIVLAPTAEPFDPQLAELINSLINEDTLPDGPDALKDLD